MKESLISAIWHHIFGYRYYIVIYVSTGTSIVCTSAPFPTKKAAKASTTKLSALIPIEIRSIRSRNIYSAGAIQNIEYTEDGSLIIN